jgi:hypothetical protein
MGSTLRQTDPSFDKRLLFPFLGWFGGTPTGDPTGERFRGYTQLSIPDTAVPDTRTIQKSASTCGSVSFT